LRLLARIIDLPNTAIYRVPDADARAACLARRDVDYWRVARARSRRGCKPRAPGMAAHFRLRTTRQGIPQLSHHGLSSTGLVAWRPTPGIRAYTFGWRTAWRLIWATTKY